MTVKECEEWILQLEGSLGEVHREVSEIKAGCESMSSRLGALESQMTSFAQILSRIEANTSSGQGQTSGNKSSSLDSPEVNHPLLDLEAKSMACQGISGALANRESMLRKIDMLVFDGRLPYGWIARVERFFRLGQYSEEDKLGLVSLCLDGAVLNWFNGEVAHALFHNWDQFKQRLLLRFTPAIEDEPRKRLLCLKKTGDISEYINEFEELSTQVTGLTEATLTNAFYNGLKPEMKEVIKLKDPHGLTNHKAAVMKMQTSVFCQVMGEPKSHTNFQTFKSTTSFQPQKSFPSHNNRAGTMLEVNTGGSKPLDTGQNSSHIPLRPRQQH
ncbi:unnamed protein product [Microthlaspi erraticum]|uniref:Retrotransposon gag domain-containing protein n=1 Tax=Microthlaspi erraticum TaxID=1685480 RepID=A0A6D2KBJ4_9BRAS|nr:unnamed protein product [Microthlaspi erraticum]